MKKIALLAAVLLLGTALVAHGGEVKRFRIATAGTAGALYPMGVLMAETINKHLPQFRASAESSAGSVANLRNLHAGRVEWGISQGDMAWFAFRGMGPFKGKRMPELRALFQTLPGWVQIFVRADSGIHSIRDFKGKKISVGRAGSGGEVDSRLILKFYGLTYKDIKPQFLSEKEGVEALKSRTIDGLIATHPLRSAAFLDLTNSIKVRMLELADDAFYKRYPFFEKGVIPPGTYKHIDYPVTSAKIWVVMLTTTRAPFTAEDIYQLLKTIFDHRDEWKDAHAAVRKYVKLSNALRGLAIPLHPGAVKFYREKGFEIPAHLIPPEMK